MTTCLPATLVALAAPCPPMLEAAVGYAGAADYVALYWEPCGDDACYDDGALSGDGSSAAFLAFARHPAVAPWLAPYDLGSSDATAREWLLVDRRARRLYVGPRADVAAVLRRQDGRPDPAEPSEPASPELLAALAQIPFEEVRVDQGRLAALVRARMERQARQVDELVRWLDARAAGRR
jgi:hypothetical protein